MINGCCGFLGLPFFPLSWLFHWPEASYAKANVLPNTYGEVLYKKDNF